MAVLNNQISGYFTSDGTAKILDILCGVDHIEVLNYTQMATQQATGRGVKFEWFRGMASDSAIEYKKTNNTDALNGVVISSGGISLVDSSLQTIGGAVATTTITNATPPVVSTASTAGLSDGDVVRLTNVLGAGSIRPAWSGVDFTIGSVVANTSFELAYMVANGAFTSGNYRKVYYDPIYYPRSRIITSVTSSGSSTVVVMSVTHGFTVGQRVTFVVPDDYGMTQLNGLRGQITAINTTTNSITVNIDSSGFTAFAWPTAVAGLTVSLPQVIPFGDAPLTVANPNADQSVLDGATRNEAIFGVRLAAGAQSPAGSNGDVIYWKATKSSQVQTS